MAAADMAAFDPAAYDGVDLADGTGPFHAQRGYVHATWARTFGSRPELFVQPATVAEVEQVVRLARHRRRRVTTTGCGHSPSDMTCTSSWLVNLDRLNRVLSIEAPDETLTSSGSSAFRPLVTVQAGIRLRDLSAALAGHGLALPNLGSINAQSLAGALATGTHGSSLQHGLLSDDVAALRITLGDGRTVTLTRAAGGDLFRAALISLGALGIVVEITLRVVPAFRLRWSQTVDSDEAVFAAWRSVAGKSKSEPQSSESSDSSESSESTDPTTINTSSSTSTSSSRNSLLWTQAHFVRVWWFPYTRRAVVWAADDADIASSEPDHVPAVSYYDSRLGYLVYHNLLYLARFIPRILPWVEWFVFGMQYGFRAGTTTSGLQPGDHALLMNCLYSQYVNEWAIPLARGPEALARLGAWLNRLQPGDPAYVDHRIPFSADGLYVHAPVEVRVTDTAPGSFAARHQPDDQLDCRPLLDPTVSDGPTLYLNAIMYRPYFADPPGTDRYYEAFEWLMRDLGGRPHWAKNFGAKHADIAAAYGSDLQRFLAVRQQADPDGLFVGPWHRRCLLGSDVPPLPLEEHECSRAADVDSGVCITGELAPAES